MTNDLKTKSSKSKNRKKNNKHKKAKNTELLNNSSSNHESTENMTEEEMGCFYVDPITGEIKTIPIEQDQILQQNSQKERYMEAYGISEDAFTRTQNFFDEFKHDYYLSILFLKKVILEVVNRRNDVTATEEDITRLLSILDTDEDGQINLREFFQLLILFLSNSRNLEKRINGTLEEQSYSHEDDGYLNRAEANEFTNFLYKFYGLQNNPNNDTVLKMFENSKNPTQTNKNKVKGEVTYGHYSREISGSINQFCFVKVI